MHSYPKMLNLYKFHEPTKGRTTEFTCQEFGYLSDCEWEFTEKLDGTNIRVICPTGDPTTWGIRGRTDKAQLNQSVIDAVMDALPPRGGFDGVTIYGECFGPGINKGGVYGDKKMFRAFDMFMHTEEGGYYLRPAERWEFLLDHDVPEVPVVMYGRLWDAYWTVQRGLKSQYGDFWAEGLVGRPMIPVRGIKGERIIVKIKHRDYYGKELVVV